MVCTSNRTQIMDELTETDVLVLQVEGGKDSVSQH